MKKCLQLCLCLKGTLMVLEWKEGIFIYFRISQYTHTHARMEFQKKKNLCNKQKAKLTETFWEKTFLELFLKKNYDIWHNQDVRKNWQRLPKKSGIVRATVSGRMCHGWATGTDYYNWENWKAALEIWKRSEAVIGWA